MKTEKNIGIAFILNAAFAVFEFAGGLMTGSTAILSDALHDLGDAVSIGVSYCLEKKSRRQSDGIYTYGYGGYSVIGGLISTLTLLLGSGVMIGHAVLRLFRPLPVNYDGMLLLAVIGVAINLCAAYVTRHGESHNQRAVNLHMLEDVLGWIAVLIGAIVMRVADFPLLDPLLSLAVSLYVLIHALGHMKNVLELMLQKSPVDTSELANRLTAVDGVSDVHHLHLWSPYGQGFCATLHLVTDRPDGNVKDAVRALLSEQGITHVTIETEAPDQPCRQKHCRMTAPHRHHCH